MKRYILIAVITVIAVGLFGLNSHVHLTISGGPIPSTVDGYVLGGAEVKTETGYYTDSDPMKAMRSKTYHQSVDYDSMWDYIHAKAIAPWDTDQETSYIGNQSSFHFYLHLVCPDPNDDPNIE